MNDQSSDAPDLAKVYQFPASFAQRRLWLVDQLAPAGPLYSICRVLLVKGDLDVTALRTSLEQIVARHEVLRTTFDLSEGELVQLIAPEVHLAFESEDLTQLPDSVREPTVHERVQAEFEAPFDLKSGPLFRCRLFRYAADEHVFIINMHHIISDGWSMDVLAKELSTLYGALSRNQTPHLPDLPIQYADYTVWQRDWLSGDTLEKERSYWISQLANVPALELPRDRPRPAGQTFNGGVFRFDISADLATAMLSLGKQERATPFMTLLAVFLVLLHRYSGQQNFCVGSPIANRGKAELEPLIGFFVNTLVIRTHFDENLTFRSFLKAVRETALDAYTHQEFPFEKIVESLNLERDRSRPPVVQVMFSFNEAGYKNLKLGDLQVSSFRTKWIRRTAKFDLTLFVTEHAAGLSLAFEYNTDLFDEATIRRLGEHFQNLIKSIVDDEGRPISGLPILVDEEYRDLVYARNQTATDYPRNADLAALLQAVADCTPDATAVEHNGDTLTYRQLDERANQLARHLLKQGATVQTMIGIYLRPSLDSVVATVAVIKIGAVYVPLDLEYPEDRLKFIIEDVDARLVVTSSDLAGRLPHASVTAICLDRVAQDLVNEAVQRPTSDARPDAVAYVIYTSGSTGTPKGVAVGHRAIARLVLNTDYVQLDKNERIAHISNFAFDAATFELWGALLNGARLVIIDRDVVLSAEEFARELRGKEITTLFLTTALFNVLAQSAPGCFASLKQLMFGGEAADPKWVRRVLADGPPGRLLNVYGPTENTTFSTWYPVTEVGDAEATIPIGRPIANTQVYVLDNSLQPVPVGVPGELYLGGDGLASGYWNRPELTGERFIENPFQTDRGARIYKTGDLVRYRADGNIEFLGRNDNQIKLRGFRIELEEIEARINQHPSVQDNVVLLRKDGRRDPRIVAYAVPMPGEGIEDHELQKFIEEKLPRYMIPAVF
ncbi:MAG: amino acid adenylation domain-containing protein, partial [Gammaproteobacteria bacterium]|nr:amino acid adenylation domain-containing protein [Gammaproteobacteria bacterium]